MNHVAPREKAGLNAAAAARMLGGDWRTLRVPEGPPVRRMRSVPVVILLCLVSPAFGDFFQDLYYGLQRLGTPSGSPLSPGPAGGVQLGNRFGRVRIVPNAPGDGHRLEFDRAFGTDPLGRPEIMDLGSFELQLAGQIQMTAGYTNSDFLTGNFNSIINNLDYSLRGKTGAQDFELSGLLNGNSALEINRFGFYSVQLNLENSVSRLTMDGLAVDLNQSANFNLGPVSLKGNVFYDLFVSALEGFGVDTSALDGIFPGSPTGAFASLGGSLFSEQQVNALIEELVGQAVGSVTAGTQVAAELPTIGTGPLLPTTGSDAVNNVPEPASLMLVALGLGCMLLRRR
jgi:hypothetical protein